MKRSATYSALAAMLLPSAFLSGCGSDTDGRDGLIEGIPTEVTLLLSSAFNGRSGNETRGDGQPAAPALDNEKINDWFIVFVDKSGKVVKVLTRAEAGGTGSVEAETFRCILPSGTYSAYAFANIDAAGLKEATGVEFTVAGAIDRDRLKNAVWKKENALNLWDIQEKPLPMSGFISSLKVNNHIEETFSIEVVRMAAKIEVALENKSDEKITVNSVSLDPVTETGISLFPLGNDGISYSHLGNSAYTPLDGAGYSRLTYSPSTPIDLDKGKKQSCSFYIQESLSDYGNSLSAGGGAFTIFLNVTHENGVAEIEQHNITSDIRGYINRNDWVVIPVTLSRYDVSVEALFYPPIGGYPAYLSTTDPDGAQVFTFGTQGDFAIVPHVIDKQTGSYLPPAHYRISIEGEVNDEAGIFLKKPVVVGTSSAIPDEILGALSSEQGKASLTLKVEVFGKAFNDSDTPLNIYTRTIYIIRDNNAS